MALTTIMGLSPGNFGAAHAASTDKTMERSQKNMTYVAKDYSNLLDMQGFSDTLLKNHFTLYQGYVTNTNKLADILRQMLEAGNVGTPEYAELKRRFGFEFNGMRLHEIYFENLGGKGVSDYPAISVALAQEFGSLEKWEKDFRAMGNIRGIGWVSLYQDPASNRLFNCWINEHEVGHLAGCTPLLLMDMFEHAFMTDYGLKKADYVESFFKNVNWAAVGKRMA
jgi:Fe-Mn family superoxide dismutase